MKKIKKLSLLISIVLVTSFVLSFSVFAHDDVKAIEENDKIFTYVPWEYELSVYSNSLCYDDYEEGNYLEFCVGENKFAPGGIIALEKWKVQTVFEHFYLYDGDIERIDECIVDYEATEKREVNGYSCYYLQGKYSYDEDIDGFFAYYFNAFIFATKENIFVVGYEDIEGNTENYGDLMTAVNGIVLNGTHFDGDKPEKNADHDFSNSPAYEDVVLASQGPIFEDGVLGIAAVIAIIMTVVPTLIVIIIAIVLISKYSKNKKKLRQYELTYGSVPSYNMPPQNYGGYGYNQPINQPYQSPVNSAYQQNPVNQNIPQTPSYVTNAVNNLDGQQPTQSAQTNLPPEMQEYKNDNENKF